MCHDKCQLSNATVELDSRSEKSDQRYENAQNPDDIQPATSGEEASRPMYVC